MADEIFNEDDAEAIFQQVLTCSPAIEPSKVDQLADRIFSKEFMVRPWRFTALLAGKDGTFWRELSERADLAKTMVPAAAGLEDFAKGLRAVADLAECVAVRSKVAACGHEDFPKWLAADAAEGGKVVHHG